MATRLVNDQPEIPREVLELDKDERWQARLEEARARREIALREKAAGKPPKKRLKPWEQEAAVPAEPIEPIIQERDSDRVDFADRVDTIRQVTQKAAAKPEADPLPETPSDSEAVPPRSHNWARLVDKPFDPEPQQETPEEPVETKAEVDAYRPPAPDEFDNILTTLAKPRSAKKAAPLVLPDAPEVKELATRYAATLEPEIEETADEVLPEPEVEEVVPLRRKRPVLLASVAMLMALMPFMAKAPPVEKGPSMPEQVVFAFQPALGVTWSLQETPVATQSGEWVPRTKISPVGPRQPVLWQPADVVTEVTGATSPRLIESLGELTWPDIAPVKLGQGTRLFSPAPEQGLGTELAGLGNNSLSGFAAQAEPTPRETTREKLPEFSNAPSKTRPPQVRPVDPDAVPEEASLVPPTPLPANPLRVTVLRPTQSDQKVADTIAADITRLGHDVVRIQSVDHSISTRNLRFFFEKDSLEAAALAKAYDAELRDFTWFRPRPSSGTAELWLTGRSAPSNPVVAARPRATVTTALKPPEPQLVLPAPTPQLVEPRKSLFQRIFLNHQRIGVTPSTGDGNGAGSVRGGSGTTDIAGSTTAPTTGDTGTGGETATTGGDTETAGGTETSSGDTSADTSGGTDTSGSDTSDSSGSDSGSSDSSGSDSGSTSDGGTSSGSGNSGNGNGNGNSGNGNG